MAEEVYFRVFFTVTVARLWHSFERRSMDNGEEERMMNGDPHNHDTNDGKLSLYRNDDLCFLCSSSASTSEVAESNHKMVLWGCCNKCVCE